MIQKVGTVSIFVGDQQRAKAFYRDVLGFEVRTDAELYPGAQARWIAVAPPGAETEIILYLPDENWSHYAQTVGQSQAVTLTVDDMAATYRHLSENGVRFIQEPSSEPWGTYAMIEDSEGNRLLLVQQPGE